MGKYEQAVRAVSQHGAQSWFSRKSGIHKVSIGYIWSGRRRATPKQAALLEPLFAMKDIPLNRWDLLYAEDTEGNPLPIASIIENKRKG